MVLMNNGANELNDIIKEYLSRMNKLRPKYLESGIHLLGFKESPNGSGYDVFYELTPDFARKNPGHLFFSIFRGLKKDLESALNKSVDLVDADSLAPIGHEPLLSQIYSLDYQT